MFVAHRLAEIEDLTKQQDWRWVPTAQNPADDATRDVPEDFDYNHRWYTGPSFLKKEKAHWPAPRTFKKTTTGEEKAADVAATAQTSHPSPDPERFSSWKRLWRATARVLQFLQLCRKREKVNVCKNNPTWKMAQRKGTKTVEKQHRSSKIIEMKYIPLDTELLDQAETLLMKRSQDKSFREDIKCLQQGKQLEGSSKLKRLDVVLEDGILALKGRIDAHTRQRQTRQQRISTLPSACRT
ncbi:unnamed protein product [Parnassius apollo]|uniref:(apollo) hypothetical protein n=1 Tax=Parnassius apollo TaxID=110799 RepID=A0A8S3W135_PARAO|nr:unnamed protein product [Parnassius apollo]